MPAAPRPRLWARGAAATGCSPVFAPCTCKAASSRVWASRRGCFACIGSKNCMRLCLRAAHALLMYERPAPLACGNHKLHSGVCARVGGCGSDGCWTSRTHCLARRAADPTAIGYSCPPCAQLCAPSTAPFLPGNVTQWPAYVYFSNALETAATSRRLILRNPAPWPACFGTTCSPVPKGSVRPLAQLIH